MNKEKEIKELKSKNKKSDDLNNQYFKNIIKLIHIKGNLINLCFFELIIIMLLGTYVLL